MGSVKGAEQNTYLYTHFGRHANPKVLYDSKDTQFLYHNVESLSYTDHAEGSSDEIDVTFTDQKKNWFYGFWPEKGHELDVYIDYYNWVRPETLGIFHCGNFIIDDITISEPGRQMSMKGVSQPAGSAWKETKVSKTWKKVTVKRIAEDLMQKYGMTNLYFYGDETVIEELEQDGETDAAFLESVCEKYGYCLKIYKVGFVIFKKSIYEDRGVIRTFHGASEWKDYTFNTTLSGTYTGARISYTNPKKAKKQADKDVPSEIEVLVGTEERVLVLSEKCDTEAEAIETAKSKVNKENEKAETLRFSMMFDPDFVASSNFAVEGVHAKIDGKYFITDVTTQLSSSGLSMSVNAHKIQERI